MGAGLSPALLLAALLAAVGGMLVARHYLPLHAACGVALAKAAIPLAYFAWFYDGTWNFLDDLTYTRLATTLLQEGESPWSLLSPAGIDKLMQISSSTHISYVWWNILGQHWFGPVYWAPVFLNVGLSYLGAHWLAQLAGLAGLPAGYRQGLFAFHLCHWEVVAWSSFINFKDCMVMTLTIAIFYYGLRVALYHGVRSAVFLAMLLVVMRYTRFYVPALLLLALMIRFLLRFESRHLAVASLTLLPLASLYLVPEVMPDLKSVLREVLGQIGVERSNPIWTELSPSLYGGVRMFLTPRPWAVQSDFSFLLIPSILHWLFVPAVVWGSFELWQQYPRTRTLLIFLLLMLVLYGAHEESQGIRQRFQLCFILGWTQFHFLWMLTRRVRTRRAGWTPARVAA